MALAEIREMTIADYDEVYAMWLACPGLGLNSVDDSFKGIEVYLKRNPTTCFVAICDGKIVGAILSGHDGRRGIISHTAVIPDYQGKGIGSMLVNRAVKAIENCGIRKILLVAFKHNTQGNAFWEKMGFTAREDLVYRNLSLTDATRIDT
ncbi:MAG: GNAT family N-acetyltransferase [Saccharofermentanaceae bacterium]|jgi:ribosomal protein S18 acetylase RimI-like enzyme|nr:GNAT family N-acetyltransferase [Saccharofermentans sp.]HPE27372.1 GNAT family N-acetyltransferase [Saccharofermentans sp.]HPG64104.1 GNAT family N-acetyltransferase [Saccharofermentans sp.]HPJ80750.1 GNAT family N-acetyltransferase [Saccharofermentans sp.]HPQ32678.1 GNAT family N-acetyltransferase [Saccharofermentans sp.]